MFATFLFPQQCSEAQKLEQRKTGMSCQYTTGIFSRTGGFQNNVCFGSLRQPTSLGLMDQIAKADSSFSPGSIPCSFGNSQLRKVIRIGTWLLVMMPGNQSSLKSLPSEVYYLGLGDCSAYLHTCSCYGLKLPLLPNPSDQALLILHRLV